MEQPVRVEPAGGVGRAYEAVTMVTKELKSASWAEFGSVDHAPVHRRIVDATVGSWRHTGREISPNVFLWVHREISQLVETLQHSFIHYQAFWIKDKLIIISASYCFTVGN